MSAVLKGGHAVPDDIATADALTRPAKPRPIPFPSRPHIEELCRTRANADNARWQAQVQRRDMLIDEATKAGYDQGERAGYTKGWYWGLVCGLIAGGIAIGGLWAAWAPLHGLLAAWGLA